MMAEKLYERDSLFRPPRVERILPRADPVYQDSENRMDIFPGGPDPFDLLPVLDPADGVVVFLDVVRDLLTLLPHASPLIIARREISFFSLGGRSSIRVFMFEA